MAGFLNDTTEVNLGGVLGGGGFGGVVTAPILLVDDGPTAVGVGSWL